MDKQVRAYFYTENDAESAKADLESYGIDEERIEPFQSDEGINLKEVFKLTDEDRITHMLYFRVDNKYMTEVKETIKAHNGQME
ncbi:hypothetical protein H0266_10845 [Halobacillus locisalis]|uniref:Uncharacterized protein n=1 Tax=Halobacillus locisalis TaxID=220753 RepID=A0A838CTY7_9BACI|nr:hypothetical protein [Halobacillus locisalis]MBA2175391.1 hypothetical protein [Halobacillus locisalis]